MTALRRARPAIAILRPLAKDTAGRGAGANNIFNLAALLLAHGTVALTGLLSTRYLTPADKGLFTMAYLWAFVAQTLVGLSLPNALLYFGAADGRSRPSWRLLAGLEAVALVAGCCLALALAAREGSVESLFLSLLCLLPAIELAFETVSYSTLVEGGPFWAYRMSQALLFGLIGIPTVYVSNSAMPLLASLFLSYLAVVLSHAVLRWLRRGRPPAPFRLRSRQLMKWAVRAHPGLVLSVLANRCDLLIVTLFLTSAAAGQYAAAVAVPSLLAYSGTALGVALAREVTTRAVLGLPTFARASQLALGGGSLVVCLALIGASDRVIRTLFGDPYAPAATILIPLAVALPFWNVASYQTQLLSALGRPWAQSVAQSLAAVVLGVGSGIGVLLSNLQVVAWSNVAAYGCAVAFQAGYLRRFQP